EPQLIPAVITTDLSPLTFERWFVLANAGECDRTALPVDVSVAVAGTIGSLQRRCSDETALSSLLPACLAEELLDVALSCCRWARMGEWPLSDSELLSAAEAELVAASGAARRVTASLERVPPTVIHGDLWAGNVARSGGGVVLIDWGSALWGVGSVDIVNLVVCRPSAFDPRAPTRCGTHTRRDRASMLTRSSAERATLPTGWRRF
ncbi:MAG: phosphotransferase, partial [Actinobacteria bacterium]|nr:phosphotransferase [Actinomycetota bacterium]